MALPTPTQIKTLDYSRNGSPWVRVVAKDSIDTKGLEYSKDGLPWIAQQGLTVAYFGILKRWNGSAWVKAKLKRYNGSTFENATLKLWNGSAWGGVDTTGI